MKTLIWHLAMGLIGYVLCVIFMSLSIYNAMSLDRFDKAAFLMAFAILMWLFGQDSATSLRKEMERIRA